ncbi:MAG: DUF3788 domain-containing protein [Treponema sp.]|nr:DUF3788 domain-containing protein [Treponema sp.]
MEKQVLTDPLVKPEDKILERALGKKYKLFMDFVSKLNEQNLMIEWNYYNDGKSWLGKILYKKKNLCWVSLWNTGFKLTFLFTEKTINGIHELEIDNEIKNMAKNPKRSGKLIAIILLMGNKKIMKDSLKILEYKKQ